eukprot:1150835-Pelagomonas_calceolata.AAC.5
MSPTNQAQPSSSQSQTGGPGHRLMEVIISSGKQEIEAGIAPRVSLLEARTVEPDGAGITSTICQAALFAVAAAIIHRCKHIASDIITSFHET